MTADATRTMDAATHIRHIQPTLPTGTHTDRRTRTVRCGDDANGRPHKGADFSWSTPRGSREPTTCQACSIELRFPALSQHVEFTSSSACLLEVCSAPRVAEEDSTRSSGWAR